MRVSLTASEAWQMDAEAIERFNAYPRRKPVHRLQTRTGAAVPTSNITTASVVLLLANPGYTEDRDDTPDGCDEWEREGWPLAYLHDEAPRGGRDWTRRRVRQLTERGFTLQQIAQRVALVQLVPWASEKFHPGAMLPSRARILDDVRDAGSRGALLVVLRCKQLWEPAIAGAEVVYGKNPLSVFVSPGNLSDDGFLRVCERLE
jgi:hypothetical protein